MQAKYAPGGPIGDSSFVAKVSQLVLAVFKRSVISTAEREVPGGEGISAVYSR